MKPFLKSPLLSPPDEPPEVAWDDSGECRYLGTDIPAVGARAVTLAEATDPQILARSGSDPEAVLLSLSEIETDERLFFALKRGTRLDGDEEPLYKIPWETWQEYAAQPVGAWLPEWDGAGLDRSLALAERRFRFAKQALDEAGVLRNYLVVLAARLGRSRRVVGKTLGLSSARIQQLNEVSEEVVADIEEFIGSATRIAILLGSSTTPREKLPRPVDLGVDEFEELLASMIAVGLMEEKPNGLCLTKDGLALLDAVDAKLKPAKSGKDRERAGDATK